MKKVLIVIIILISFYAIQKRIPPIPLLTLYGFIAITPFLLKFVKNNLFWALLLWFFFSIFKEMGKIPLPMLPDISPERLIWVSMLLFFVTDVAVERKRKMLPVTGIEISMLSLCILIIFSMINAGTIYSEEQGLTVRPLLVGYLMPFSIFFLAKNIVDSEQKIKNTYIFFAVIGLYLGFTAICEYFNLWYLVWPPYIRNRWTGIHWGRSRGPFLQAAINGYVQGIIVLFTTYLLIHTKNKKLKIIFPLSILLMLCGIVFSFSRATWLGFIVSSFVIPLFSPKARKIYIVCFLALIIVISTRFSAEYLSEMQGQSFSEVREEGSLQDLIATRVATESSVYGRFTLYGVVWRMFLDKPIFGFGFNTFLKESPKYFEKVEGVPYTIEAGTNVHDTFTGVLVELGLVGLFLFLFILFQIFVVSIKLYRRLPKEEFIGKGLVVVFWGIFVAYYINMQLRHMTLIMFPSALFYLMSGIICGWYQRILNDNENGPGNNAGVLRHKELKEITD